MRVGWLSCGCRRPGWDPLRLRCGSETCPSDFPIPSLRVPSYGLQRSSVWVETGLVAWRELALLPPAWRSPSMGVHIPAACLLGNPAPSSGLCSVPPPRKAAPPWASL